MGILDDTLLVAGALTVASSVAGDAELTQQLGVAVPAPYVSPTLAPRLESAITALQLPPKVVVTHPEALMVEVLLDLGHEVSVVVAPASKNGPAIEAVEVAHPARCTVRPLLDDYFGFTVFNSALLTVGVLTSSGMAVQAHAGIALDYLGSRFRRRYSLSIGRASSRPVGWATVSSPHRNHVHLPDDGPPTGVQP